MRAHEEAVAAAKARAQTADDEVRHRDLVPVGAVRHRPMTRPRLPPRRQERAQCGRGPGRRGPQRDGLQSYLLMRTAWSSRLWLSRGRSSVPARSSCVWRMPDGGGGSSGNACAGDRIHRPGDLVWKRADGSCKLRQLSDAANRQTRTFEARYVLEGRLADAPLGSTIFHPDLGRPVGAAGADRRDLRSGQGPGVWLVEGNGKPARRRAVHRRPQRRSGFGRRQSRGGRSRRGARCASAARRRARAPG